MKLLKSRQKCENKFKKKIFTNKMDKKKEI